MTNSCLHAILFLKYHWRWGGGGRHTQSVKTIGSNGQISLGKEYAGRPVLVEEIEEGVWLIKTARIIPDNEIWMHKEPVKSRIDKAVKWAEKNKPAKTDLEALSAKVG